LWSEKLSLQRLYYTRGNAGALPGAASLTKDFIMGATMQVGSPFDPYKVFQGIFAPYWLLEHRGISTGPKLCYIRLLG
jgi:hypothetical protein